MYWNAKGNGCLCVTKNEDIILKERGRTDVGTGTTITAIMSMCITIMFTMTMADIGTSMGLAARGRAGMVAADAAGGRDGARRAFCCSMC